jgi:hypothetical protein
MTCDGRRPKAFTILINPGVYGNVTFDGVGQALGAARSAGIDAHTHELIGSFGADISCLILSAANQDGCVPTI